MVVPFFISHQGCPHRCVFCEQEKISGGKGTLPRAEEMQATVARYRESSNGRSLEAAFYGGTFTALRREDQEYLLAALQPLLSSGTLDSLRLSTRPDAVDPETASFLKTMGVQTVELGVQSMDEEVLRLSGRGHSAADSGRAVRVLQEAGISVGLQLMPGLPGDSMRRSLASLEEALSLDPSFLRIYPTLVISGTGLADLYRAGSYLPLSLDQAVSLCKRMLLRALQAGVPVLRLGLQPTAELDSPGGVLAGPYHPVFGQLVESELFYHLMSRMAVGIPRGSRVAFLAPPGRISDLVGQKRRNLTRLAENYGVTVTSVRGDATLGRHEIALESGRWSRSADLLGLEL